MADFKKLEDYGIIGNLDTCALVGRDGSIDWCCFPHMEAPSLFAAILDTDWGGHFAVRPSGPFDSDQAYVGETNILRTAFRTSSGTVTLTDFMPARIVVEPEALHQAMFRKVTCDDGEVTLEIDFAPRFDYGRAETIITPTQSGALATGNHERVFLYAPVEFEVVSGRATATRAIKAGESFWLLLRYGIDLAMKPGESERILEETLDFWGSWAHDCGGSPTCLFYGPWHGLVVRSGLILKLLTHHETGSIAAAPTTSIPEEVGGERNWDYRFNWIRDAAFSVQALFNLGHTEEAKRHLRWFIDICKSSPHPEAIQIIYGMHGETDLLEEKLNHLSGYRNSRPVRIGNAAAGQTQLDIYGELINAFYETTRYGEGVTEEDWTSIKMIVDYVCKIWDTEDYGIWEVRSGPQHFVYSKLMCWVALDRGIKMAESKGYEAPLAVWARAKDEIRAAILDKGFSQKLNSFVQALGSESLDASNLLIPMMGFLPFDDGRVQGTIDATLENLTSDEGLVYRYVSGDGLRGQEGTFVLCTFWLVNALSLSGRVEEAEGIFMNVLKHISPSGLLSEEIDPRTGEQLGNFPQAFSHIGLINSAIYLGKAKGKAQMDPEPVGTHGGGDEK
jgi:GH15 family glucan-1,4-alpha-glucosidase